MTNRLHIKGEHFEAHLSGDSRYVTRAYDALRPLLIDYVEACMLDAQGGRSGEFDLPTGAGKKALNVVVCHDFYRKTYVADRAAVSKAPLFAHLDTTMLRAVHVERDIRHSIVRALSLDRPLWSELTPTGAAAVSGAKK